MGRRGPRLWGPRRGRGAAATRASGVRESRRGASPSEKNKSRAARRTHEAVAPEVLGPEAEVPEVVEHADLLALRDVAGRRAVLEPPRALGPARVVEHGRDVVH